MASRFVSFIVAGGLILSGCSHASTGGTPFIPQALNSTLAPAGTLVVRVTENRAERSPHYLSPSTKAMIVDVTGPTTFKKIVGLTLGTVGCKSSLMTFQCALRVPGLKSCPSSKPCYTAEIQTYDRYWRKKIPRHAHLLSTIDGLNFHVGNGMTVIPLVLDGIPASVSFIPSTETALVGTQAAGFIFPKCESKPQRVNIVGVDADGNYITGPGAPTIKLTSNDPAQLTIVAGPAPNTFSLRQPAAPAYAHGNHTILLTAAARPAGKNLGPGAVTRVKVRYSGDICGVITEFAIPTSGASPYDIAAGPDGRLWIPEYGAAKIARVTPSGKFKEFPVRASAEPLDIVAGPDGNIWFTEYGKSRIGKMTTAGKLLFERFTTTANSGPSGITVGPDRHLWFTEGKSNKIGSIKTGGNLFAEVAIPTGGSDAIDIVTGPDDALWFTEQLGYKIGRVTTSGAITDYSVPSGTLNPAGIVNAHGALWFAQSLNNSIARIDVAGNVTSEYPLPHPSSGPFGMDYGPDGGIWFAEVSGNRIGRLAFDGTFTEFNVPTPASQPYALAVGPDGALWFVEKAGNKVGRLR